MPRERLLQWALSSAFVLSACGGSMAGKQDSAADAGGASGSSGGDWTASGSGSGWVGSSASSSGSGRSSSTGGGAYAGSSSTGGGVDAPFGGGSSGVRCGPGSASRVNSGTEVIALTAGREHACVLLAGGSVVCWGANSYGQLGDGATCDSSTPVPVQGLGSAISVSAGEDHTCAVLEDHTVRCWGDNLLGQLGNGTTATSSPQPQPPVTVLNLDGVVSVAAGNQRTCALLVDGTVQCWGRDTTPWVGSSSSSGGQAPSSTPVSVPGLSKVAALSAGYDFMCALLVDGTAQCWGSETNGRLGDGASSGFPPGPVTVSGLDKAIALAAGNDGACALRSDGTVRCWGNGFYGQLGNGLELPAGGSSGGAGPSASPPVPVANIDDATGVAAGGEHACALRSGGTGQCWGWNSSGQLGDGTTTPSSLPVTVHGLQGAARIACGHEFACAAQAGGIVQCWGNNVRGQLGDGTFTDSPLPVTVHWQ